ncbi:cytochrome P450 [Dactylosporangium matsuzakiense]|uniref:Cytochrome P450 126 n=1 Tax=Dactylosporangium matsuzakiense TaxID=53360 RepID=A0A9W6KKF4_9ACTN|nr:cytochrome P450 [Dactylosporangium matsuzakiense]GLL02149.1 putative cytochrome P450 126 [Dactylosporangium matsuzakiense]
MDMLDGERGPGTASSPVNLVDPDLYAAGDPFAVWRWLRENRPVHWHEPTHMPGFWAVSRYDDVRAVLHDPATFSSASGILLRPQAQGVDPGGGRTLALTDPPRHGQLRQVVARWFAAPSVRALEERMRETVRLVLRRAVERETVDFVTDVAARLPLYVICGLLGAAPDDYEQLFVMTSRAFGDEDAVSRSAAHTEILRYFMRLVAERRRTPHDDLVGALVTAAVGDARLTTQEILLSCDNLLVAGTENVRLSASGGMQAFLTEPAQWARLVTNPRLASSAVEEILRYTSPATHIMRTATTATRLGDRPIEAGERVVVWLPSANRDERIFDAPERCDIERSPNRHVALGSGEHFCLGALLARLQLRVLFEELAHSVDVEPDGPPRRLRSIVVNGLAELPVRMTYRAEASGTGPR